MQRLRFESSKAKASGCYTDKYDGLFEQRRKVQRRVPRGSSK